MYAKQTPYGKLFHRRLAILNDQIWLMDLMNHAFLQFIGSNHDTNNDIDIVFPNYANSTRLKFTIKQTNTLLNDSLPVYFSHIYVSSYEMADAYIKDLIFLIRSILKIEIDLDGGDDTIIKKINKIETAMALQRTQDSDKIVRAIELFRTMRNHIVHQTDATRNKLVEFNRNNSYEIEKSWRHKKGKEMNLNLKDLNPDDFVCVELLVNMIRLLRASCAELDKRVSSKVELYSLIPHYLQEVSQKNPKLSGNKKAVARKVSSLINIQYGGSITPENVLKKIE